jgi:hypothetical protein
MGGWGAMPHAPTLAGFGFVMGPSQVYALGSFRGAFAFNHAAITEACVAKFWGVSVVLAGENKSSARHRKSSPLHRLAGGAR